MTPVLELDLSFADWLGLFIQYLGLSLMSIGGAISTVPEMHRYLVERQNWLTETQFNGSISVAQAAPGPNVLFVALMGWNVGLNAGGIGYGLLGVLVTMFGILLPSTTLTYAAARWIYRNRDRRGVRAFKYGMAPIVVALIVATGWILASVNNVPQRDWPFWLLTAGTAALVLRTRLHLLWMLGTGALVGALWLG